MPPWLSTPPRGSLGDRVRVYVEGYPARIHEALADAYPAVAHLVGASAFLALAERYAARVRPASFNLNDAGARLGEVLEDDELGRDLPFLPDLARLEWLVQRAFHSHEAPPLDPRSLVGAAPEEWERLRIPLQPAVGVIRSAWPVLDLWICRKTPREEIDLEIEGRPQSVVVSRSELVVRCEAVSDAEAAALERLGAGSPIAEAARTLARFDLAPARVTELFARWLRAGLLAAPEGGR